LHVYDRKGKIMTGEMSASEVTREAYPIHFAIADALGGEVRPFDQYQGPYVRIPARGRARSTKLWLVYTFDGAAFRVYDAAAHRQSALILACDGTTAEVAAAQHVLDRHHWHKVNR
jgi:hypothetical protein